MRTSITHSANILSPRCSRIIHCPYQSCLYLQTTLNLHDFIPCLLTVAFILYMTNFSDSSDVMSTTTCQVTHTDASKMAFSTTEYASTIYTYVMWHCNLLFQLIFTKSKTATRRDLSTSSRKHIAVCIHLKVYH